MTAREKVIMVAQRILARGLMTRFSCQSRIPLPAIGRDKSQAWKRGDDFEKR